MGIATTNGADTKARLIAVATDLFAEKGYRGASMADLEKAGGFPRGVIYHHVRSKEQLLYEIVIVLIRSINGEFAAVLGSAAPPDEKLRRAARLLVNHAANNVNGMRTFYREWIWLTGEYHTEVVAALNWYEAGFQTILTEGEAAGLFTEVDAIATKGILSLFNQTHSWVKPDGRLSPDQVADRLSDLVLNGISTQRHQPTPDAHQATEPD